MLQAAILLAFIKLQFVIKIFVLSIFDCPFYTSFTVLLILKAFLPLPHLIWNLICAKKNEIDREILLLMSDENVPMPR